MKRKRQGFHFRGFVALADTLFAVSAGLLLLNPIRFEAKPDSTPKPKPEPQVEQVQVILVEMQNVEQRLDKLEAGGRNIQNQAAEVIKNE